MKITAVPLIAALLKFAAVAPTCAASLELKTAGPGQLLLSKDDTVYAVDTRSGAAHPLGQADLWACDPQRHLALATKSPGGRGSHLTLGHLSPAGQFMPDAHGDTDLLPQSLAATHHPDRPFCLVGVSPGHDPRAGARWRAAEVSATDGRLDFAPVAGVVNVVTIIGAAGLVYAPNRPGTLVYCGEVENPNALNGTNLAGTTGTVLALVVDRTIRRVWLLQGGPSSASFLTLSTDATRLFGWLVLGSGTGNPYGILDLQTGQKIPCDWIDEHAEVLATNATLDCVVASVRKAAGDSPEPGQLVYDGPPGDSVQLLRPGHPPLRLLGLDESHPITATFDGNRLVLTDGKFLWIRDEDGTLKKLEINFP